MALKKTICDKLHECLTEVKNALANKPVNIGLLTDNLHLIRQDAQHMENALKLRKEMMIEAGLEEEYKKRKQKSDTITGSNVIAGTSIRQNKPLQYHILLTDKMNNDKVIYETDLHGGVLSMVERVEEIDEQGSISGLAQQFMFGHDLTVFFAFNQLEHGMESRGVQIALALREAVKNKVFSDPEAKKHLLKLMNNMSD